MSASTPVARVIVPQVNVNDDTVVLVRWHVQPGATVAAGDAVCDVETTKAATEIVAPAAGVIAHRVVPGTHVSVGQTIGAIGSSLDDAEAALKEPDGRGSGQDEHGATPKATALAHQHGVSLSAVRAAGVKGTIKEGDVRAFMSKHGESTPHASSIVHGLADEGPMPAFDLAIASNLRRSTSRMILTSVDMDCRLGAVLATVKDAQSRGVMASVLHVIVAAVARALPGFPRLMTVAHDGKLYRHRAVDVAFVARVADGRLFTPVIRNPAAMAVEEIAKVMQAASLRAARGTLAAAELEGAAFTISQVPVPGTTRVVALPSLGQSAILGVSAERDALELREGVVRTERAVTLTLTYDHALCDGVYAANFLGAIVKDMENGRG